MVHWWQDPAIEAQIFAIYGHMIYLLLGVYGWEYCQNFGVEYAVIHRRLPFRWPLIPYLIGRLFLLIDLILVAIGQSPLSDYFSCELSNILLLGTATIVIASSSTNLMIRTWVIWKDSRLVHILVLLASMGHYTFLILNWTIIKSTSSDGACSIYITSLTLNAAIYVYTMCYDFLALVLSIVKLSSHSSRKSLLMERLRSQHLLYFAVAATANIPPTIFALLGSQAMVAISSILAGTASTIVSCRLVRSLLLPPAVHLCRHREAHIIVTTQLPHVSTEPHND